MFNPNRSHSYKYTIKNLKLRRPGFHNGSLICLLLDEIGTYYFACSLNFGIADCHPFCQFFSTYGNRVRLRNEKLTSKYPHLFHSDLRLCAYLRMNLTSKEIAPLLQISYRGVENHHYRLRKKLLLKKDVNLSDFILSL